MYVGCRLADVEFTEDQEEGAGKKDGLARPPLPAVQGVATTLAAQDTHDHSSRQKADDSAQKLLILLNSSRMMWLNKGGLLL